MYQSQGRVIGEQKPSGAEKKVVAASAKGEFADLRSGQAEADNPAKGADWGYAKRVRAKLLIELLTAQRTLNGRPARAVKLIGARICGPLRPKR